MGPKLREHFTHVFDSATLPYSMGEALTEFIPKPGIISQIVPPYISSTGRRKDFR